MAEATANTSTTNMRRLQGYATAGTSLTTVEPTASPYARPQNFVPINAQFQQVHLQEAMATTMRYTSFWIDSNRGGQGTHTIHVMGQEENGWDFLNNHIGYHRTQIRHELHNCRYEKGNRKAERLNERRFDNPEPAVYKLIRLTMHLAPLDEETEIAPRKVIRHLKKLLHDPHYRRMQLRHINRINKASSMSMAVYDEKLVQDALKEHLKNYHRLVRSAEQQRREQDRRVNEMREAQARAEKLLATVLSALQLEQYHREKRVEIIAKNGAVYELLSDGRVNRLLPNGEKQGLCAVPKEGMYPAADVVVMKKLMLEAEPENFEEVAHKTTAFPIPVRG
jgi:hypothetical protein